MKNAKLLLLLVCLLIAIPAMAAPITRATTEAALGLTSGDYFVSGPEIKINVKEEVVDAGIGEIMALPAKPGPADTDLIFVFFPLQSVFVKLDEYDYITETTGIYSRFT